MGLGRAWPGLFWLGLAWPGASSPSPHITSHSHLNPDRNCYHHCLNYHSPHHPNPHGLPSPFLNNLIHHCHHCHQQQQHLWLSHPCRWVVIRELVHLEHLCSWTGNWKWTGAHDQLLTPDDSA